MVNFSWERDRLRRTNQRENRDGKNKSHNLHFKLAIIYSCNYLRSYATSGERQETESQSLDSIYDSIIRGETVTWVGRLCNVGRALM